MKNPVTPPRYYGLEYELQFVAKNPETGEIETLTVQEGTKTAIRELVAAGDPGNANGAWETLTGVLWLSYTTLGRLTTVLGMEGGILLDLGNIEVCNITPAESVEAAVAEIDQQVVAVGEYLAAQLPFSFALFLPAIKLRLNRYKDGYTIETTKHLNISYSSEELLSEAVQAMRDDYPHYFAFRYGTISVKDEGGTGKRLHLKLPYTFASYDELFEGTAELPDLKYLIAQAAAGKNIDWEAPTLLGVTSRDVGAYGKSKRYWIVKNSIV